MKRKQPLEPTKPSNEEILKPQLKKAKPNNYKGPSLKSININRNFGSQNKTIASTSDSSADRSSVSLLSNDKPIISVSKDSILNVEEAKICKNLNEAYKEIDLTTEATEPNKTNSNEIKGLKDARKIAKLNKLGGTILDSKIAFPKKILKNTTNNSKPSKSSTTQQNKEEEKKKPEDEPGNQILEVIIDLSSKSTPEQLVTEDDKTPGASTADEVSPKEEQVAGEAHPIDSLLTKFEGVPVVETKVAIRRNPRENKWHNRTEQEGGKDDKNESDADKGSVRQSRKETSSVKKSETGKRSSRSKNASSPRVLTRTIVTRASSAKARAANPQGNVQSEFKSPAKPAQKVIRATNRVNKSASASKDKISSSEEEMEQEQLEIETSMFEEVKEENNRLKKDMVMQEHEMEEAKKEREELIKMIEAIENEKFSLLKESEDKEKDLKERENAIETIRKQLVLSEFYRTNLNNYIQDLRGNLRIYCRVKPVYELKKPTVFYPQKQQYIAGCQLEVSYDENGRQVLPRIALNSLEIGSNSQSRSTYYFDRVFDETLTQEDIFEEVLPFIQSAVDGEKVCILAYGQTGSGKTYTIEGPHFEHISDATSDVGILPRAVDFVLREAVRLEVQNTTIEIQLACMEIYNENLTDLLAAPEERTSIGSFSFQGINNFVANIRDKFKGKDKEKEAEKESSKLVINSAGNKITVNGLTWAPIKDNEQLFETINKAFKARMMDAATWKERSMKSHCIYKLKLIRSDGKEGVLNIVDLGGCERSEPQPADTKSALEVARLKKAQTEGNCTTKSLATLGRIMKLVADKKPDTMIPYRDSKLTKLLQDTLGSTGKTLLFINICPTEENLSQSKEALKFSLKATL